jgi:hypothetical protein
MSSLDAIDEMDYDCDFLMDDGDDGEGNQSEFISAPRVYAELWS